MKRFRKHLGPILWILLSFALTPFAHDWIKPYRLRVDLNLGHAKPTHPAAYYSTSRKNPHYFEPQNVVGFLTTAQTIEAPQSAREVAYIASSDPITNLRIDPSISPSQLELGSLSVHSLWNEANFSLSELLTFLANGQQISNLRKTDTGIAFDTTGNDPSFNIPIPPSIGIPTKLQVIAWYVVVWLSTISILYLAKIVLFEPHKRFNNNGAHPIKMGKVALYLPNVSSRFYNLMGMGVLAYTLIQLIGMTVGMDFSHVQKALEKDRVSSAIPREVLWMQTLAKRQGVDAFVLAGDLGRGGQENEIYQRATEYLYPIKVMDQTKWVMARQGDLETSARSGCNLRDRQEGIVLYACEK